jgi:hypothetical protein
VGLEPPIEDSTKPAPPTSIDESTNVTDSNIESNNHQAELRDDSHLEDEHNGETVVEAEEDTVIY